MSKGPTLETSTIVFNYPGCSRPGLKALARRYRRANLTQDLQTGLTLIFTHGGTSRTPFHIYSALEIVHSSWADKEVWEPVIQVLLGLPVTEKSSARQNVPVIREAWSLEWQNHGESAIVNHSILTNGHSCLSLREWEAAVRHFAIMKSQQGHQLVGIGHSVGACTMVSDRMKHYSLRSTMSLPPGVPVPYSAMIFVEDSLSTRAAWDMPGDPFRRNLDAARNASGTRRGTWTDRQQAYDFLSRDKLYVAWDKRISDLFLCYCLRDTLPSERGHPGVTLACSRTWEKAWYCEDEYELLLEAADHLVTIDPALDIHCVYGDREDFIPQSAHDSILSVRRMASVQRIPNAGHAVVQENPDEVAFCLKRILQNMAAKQPLISML
ncbi:hypothetical protein OBBRIDRAFT_735198 [Obba rivulosa]|uniref:AB hydrolase-1 domain-containing protein n=1 Tax=Obba rivulosa TaxID=1052685 RepID=A0A8E2APM1_9APHY|nr:hypothetical protein OBBRIDRAFT_735198 [Obba rivulosa]